ncbi:hypothetical protein JTB14_028245 [Gonioctena quinquepunctata]|nr:hypothetical protein JTB14_028245 [Gonioctena quinquepunctata]
METRFIINKFCVPSGFRIIRKRKENKIQPEVNLSESWIIPYIVVKQNRRIPSPFHGVYFARFRSFLRPEGWVFYFFQFELRVHSDKWTFNALIRKSRRSIMATRGKKILLLAQQENEEIENHPLFLPPYETTKGTSSVQQQKYASSATTETENPSSIGHFDNFPESLGENNEDSTTPVLLTNNPLSIEFSN